MDIMSYIILNLHCDVTKCNLWLIDALSILKWYNISSSKSKNRRKIELNRKKIERI
ncbi:MAG: hypothetical protein K0R92_1360 [Lachnospiraceae bacterium]|jgi:hypothetical protein|nr:hypothetical protein [Lachnospiraceae bacterium]